MDKVSISPEFCKGCGYCIRFCPKAVLSLGTEVNSRGIQYAVALHPENCISCCACALMCPDAAIEIYK